MSCGRAAALRLEDPHTHLSAKGLLPPGLANCCCCWGTGEEGATWAGERGWKATGGAGSTSSQSVLTGVRGAGAGGAERAGEGAGGSGALCGRARQGDVSVSCNSRV